MLLCVDVGNTHTSLGVFDGEQLVQTITLSTHRERTPDEYGAIFISLLGERLPGARVVIASVVPVVEGALFEAFARYAGSQPLRVSASSFPYLPNRTERPKEVGVDRLVNAYAGMRLYGKPLIVIDLGTAATCDVLDREGTYLGGAILPGLEMASRALYAYTARLPQVRIEKPPAALGRNTITALESGLYYGLVGALTEVARRIQEELGYSCTVAATGGHARLVAEGCSVIEHVNPHLTLEGLRMIADEMA